MYAKHYYQERFDFADVEDNLTLGAFLSAGTAADAGDVRAAAGALGIGELLPVTFIKLSNGQVRRARIARALLGRPAVLVLDEPFMGLDAAGRGELAELLGGLIRGGLRVVVVTRPGTLPAWVSHVMELQDGNATWQGAKAAFTTRGVGWAESSRPTIFLPSPPVGEGRGAARGVGGNAPATA